jgi:hypothetical protein
MNPEILGTIITAKDGILYIFGLFSVKQSALLKIDKKRKETQIIKFEAYLEEILKRKKTQIIKFEAYLEERLTRKKTQIIKFEAYLEDRLKHEEDCRAGNNTLFTSVQFYITGRVSGLCSELLCGENHTRMPIKIYNRIR